MFPSIQQLKKIARRLLRSVLFILVSVWVLLSLMMHFFQSQFIYFPQAEINFTPDMIGLVYEDIYFKTDDEIELNGWFIPAAGAKRTLLFFHGNGGNISHRLDSLKIFHDMGLSVFIIDYRGYGRSQGTPGEEGTYLDAKAAWKHLTQARDIPQEEIIIFGRSLGGAVATWLASQHNPNLLMLESTFTSVVDMGKHYYPYLPIKLLTRIKYASIDRIEAIRCPVLISHSQTDEIVPFKFGQTLFEKVQAPKVFLELQGGHNDGFITSGQAYIQGLEKFLAMYAGHAD